MVPFSLSVLKIKVWDIEIPRFDFLFNCIPEGTIIDVEPHNLVILNYRYFKFIFIEGESVSNVLQSISSIIKGVAYYSLQTLPDCTTLNTNYKLSSKQKFVLHITHNFTFCQINGTPFDKQFDYLTTVAELKNTFSVSFSIGCQLTPANIIVYDYNINQIARDNDRLIDVVTFNQQIGKLVIFFDISYNTQSQFLPIPSLPPQQQQQQYQQNMSSSQHQQKPQNPATMQSINSSSDNRRMSTSDGIEIHFIFDNGSGIDFVQNALFDTRIDTLIKSLTVVYRLTGKVEIAYKDKKTNRIVILDHNKTAVDYIDEMMSYGENRLYIETDIKEDKKQQNKQSYVPQKKPTENPEPEEKPSSVPPKKAKQPEPEEEPKQPESEKKSERKKIAVKKFKPKVTKTDEVENENESKPSEKKKKDSTQREPTKYQFKYDDEYRKIKFDDNSYLADNEEKIKQKFEIDDDVEIEYFTINEDDDDDENPIKNLNTLMKKFKNKTILIKKVHPITDTIFIDEEEEKNHKILKKIGEGATSIAYKIIDKRTSEIMCKKVVKTVEEDKVYKIAKNSLNEISALNQINHPCICRIIRINLQEKVNELNDDDDDDDSNIKTTIALFLEYLPIKLSHFLRSDKINNTLRVKIAIEVAFGMHHIHELGMIHRDLKIENIMLDDDYFSKIIDFDLVHIEDISEESLTKGIGTFDYMSPEMLNKKNYDNKTDVYSYGIVLYVIFTGNHPNQNLTEKMTMKQIEFPQNSSLTKECKDLIIKCTYFEPSKRPSFKEIIDYIKIKSFKLANGIDFKILDSRYQELTCIQIKYQSTQKSKK